MVLNLIYLQLDLVGANETVKNYCDARVSCELPITNNQNLIELNHLRRFHKTCIKKPVRNFLRVSEYLLLRHRLHTLHDNCELNLGQFFSRRSPWVLQLKVNDLFIKYTHRSNRYALLCEQTVIAINLKGQSRNGKSWEVWC